jgi:hypothetical protein
MMRGKRLCVCLKSSQIGAVLGVTILNFVIQNFAISRFKYNDFACFPLQFSGTEAVFFHLIFVGNSVIFLDPLTTFFEP